MVEKPNRLGRGLAALIGDMAPMDEARTTVGQSGGQKRLPLDFIIAASRTVASPTMRS